MQDNVTTHYYVFFYKKIYVMIFLNHYIAYTFLQMMNTGSIVDKLLCLVNAKLFKATLYLKTGKSK